MGKGEVARFALRCLTPALLGSLLFIISSLPVAASDTSGFDLFVGGGIGGAGPNFYVSLDRVGHLKIRRTGLPPVGPGKFTESSTSIKIKPAEAKRLIALAEASTDFSTGCHGVPDGTSARLSLETDRGPVERKCVGAGTWPNGRNTKLFLKKLNSKLPQKFQVF